MSKSGITYLKKSPLPGYIGEAWNPIIGCTHSGDSGCDHCWARELHNMRYQAYAIDGANMPAQYHLPFNRIQCIEERFHEPYSWKKPRLVMVCPQSDLFHEDVPYSIVCRQLDVIHRCQQHQFFVPTKRTERAAQCLDWYGESLPNLGVLASISDQTSADRLLPHLVQINNIGWRGVSYEPAVGPVDLSPWLWPFTDCHHYDGGCTRPENVFADTGNPSSRPGIVSCNKGACIYARVGIDLVIAGCESGTGRRHADPAWFRSVRDQALESGTHFYLKQMAVNVRVQELPFLDGRQWQEWPDHRNKPPQ